MPIYGEIAKLGADEILHAHIHNKPGNLHVTIAFQLEYSSSSVQVSIM